MRCRDHRKSSLGSAHEHQQRGENGRQTALRAGGAFGTRFGFCGLTQRIAERFSEIYRRLDEAPSRGRSARFVCALAVVHAGTVVYETTGTIEGSIADAPRGVAGFGYDPVFYYPPYGRTLGDVTEEAKLRVAHRGEAFRRWAVYTGLEQHL